MTKGTMSTPYGKQVIMKTIEYVVDVPPPPDGYEIVPEDEKAYCDHLAFYDVSDEEHTNLAGEWREQTIAPQNRQCWFGTAGEFTAIPGPIRAFARRIQATDPRNDWVPTSERMPTAEDSNSRGEVLWTGCIDENILERALQTLWNFTPNPRRTHWRTAHEPPKA